MAQLNGIGENPGWHFYCFTWAVRIDLKQNTLTLGLGMKKLLCLMLVILGGRLQAQNQQYLNFGASTNLPGATLVFENASDCNTDSGLCFPTVSGSVHDPNLTFGPNAYPYAGYYYNCVQIFNSLPATDGDGNLLIDGAAALGTVIQLQLMSAEGPAGASFAFFVGNSDGSSYGTNLTWSVPVPSNGNTNLILITQAANTPTNDPYGYIQNAVFGFTKPGLYKLTWRLVDTSTNGPGGTPLDQPSAPFTLYYQAGCTISGITSAADGLHLIFAAPYGSLQPDNSGFFPPAIQHFTITRTWGWCQLAAGFRFGRTYHHHQWG